MSSRRTRRRRRHKSGAVRYVVAGAAAVVFLRRRDPPDGLGVCRRSRVDVARGSARLRVSRGLRGRPGHQDLLGRRRAARQALPGEPHRRAHLGDLDRSRRRRRRRRGRALLRARRRRHPRYRARRGHRRHVGQPRRGRLDDHAAVRRQHAAARRAHSSATSATRPARRSWRWSSRSARARRRSSSSTSTRSTSAKAPTVRRRRPRRSSPRTPRTSRSPRPLCSPVLPQAPSATQSLRQPRRRRSPDATRSCATCTSRATSTRRSTTRRSPHLSNSGRTDEPEHGIYQAHYFVAHVKKLLQQEFSQSLVFQGGLDVYTTIDTRTQKMAEDAVYSSFKRASDPDVALVSIDPRNGQVKAMVGGRTTPRTSSTSPRRDAGSPAPRSRRSCS